MHFGPFGDIFGPFRATWAILGAFGPSAPSGPSRTFLDHSGLLGHLGPFLGLSGPFRAISGPFRAIFWAFWNILGRYWAILGRNGAVFGGVLGLLAFRAVSGRFGISGHFGAVLGYCMN